MTDRKALGQAMLLLDAFIAQHGAAAIPAMLAACVGWACEHGAPELVRDSLTNAIALSHNIEAARKDTLL